MKEKIFNIIFVFIFLCCIGILLVHVNTKPNTVVFIGDSITYFGNNTKNGFIRQFGKNFSSKFNIIAKGNCGDGTHEILDRIYPDVVNYHPDIMVLMIGINDINNESHSKEDMKQTFSEIIDIVKENNIEPIILNVSPISEDFNNSKTLMVDEYNKQLEELSKEKDFQLIDINTPLKEEISKHSNSKFVVLEDNLHLNATGNTIVANSIIKEFTNKYSK